MASTSSSPSSSAASGPPTGREEPAGTILQFARLEGSARDDFWRRFAALKLDALGLDDSPIPITGFYAPCSNCSVSQPLFLIDESLPPDSKDIPPLQAQAIRGDRNKCPIPGTLYNANTLENFRAFDKKSLLRKEAKKLLYNIHSGKVEEDPAVLAQFLLISFADLKKWEFIYWFAFPALVLNPPAKLINIQPAKDVLTSEQAISLSVACSQWRNLSSTAGIPFFIISISSDSCATILQLKDWEKCQGNGQKLLFGFYDTCHAPRNPGWPLRNYLTFIALRYKVEKITFFSYREVHGQADLQLSLIGETFIPTLEGWEETQYVPEAVGWAAKAARRNLAESMDQKRLARSASELNLKLMKWRTLPSLALENLANTKCLLLGAGTLGCQVARMLLAWGVRKITLVDSGRVSMSNPVRQSLYTFEDCLNSGKLKAVVAASHLQDILPDVESEGIVLSIPMPGHATPPSEMHRVLEDCNHLQSLISSHDVTFLLTDTRESRWLPTFLCATENKIAITAALGFDSYLVMRHGAGPLVNNSCHPRNDGESVQSTSATDGNKQQRLGCYFCNDVVAPIDSTSNRTLDQQCTVTRPGLAPIASALAVELLVGLLHHPEGIHAQAETASSIINSCEQPFGILPHQIRGLISQFSQMTLIGYSSSTCTACSSTVVSEYRNRGMEFVLEVINHPTYLEDITGLTDLMRSASSFKLNSNNDIDEDDDDYVQI